MRDRQEDGSVWHQGEIAVQKRAGVLLEAKPLQEAIHSTIPDPFRAFIAAQRFAALGTIDSQARLWASLCTGEPGFMHCPNRFSVHVEVGSGNELAVSNIKAHADVGMLIIDLASRRRIRLNGEAELLSENALLIQARQIYSNCPRYIQQRVFESESESRKVESSGAQISSRLTGEQTEMIQRADTFFIASAHREFGVDVSHRGGNPGFIRVENNQRLIFPDYNGNKMFNTLGNISTNPSVGLLFPDFANGRILQLTGRASIEWDSSRFSEFPGAERAITVDIEVVIEPAASLPNYRFQSYSSHNPSQP